MKIIQQAAYIFIIILFLIAKVCNSQTNPNHVWVNPFIKSDGASVPGHFRTAPNKIINDNFSTQGNINPYTLQPGWVPRQTNENLFSNTIIPQYNVYYSIERDTSFYAKLKARQWLNEMTFNSSQATQWALERDLQKQKMESLFMQTSKVMPTMVNQSRYRNEIEFHQKYSFFERNEFEALLVKNGYNSIIPDGIFDDNTITSIINFQDRNQLIPDGLIGQNTEKALLSNSKISDKKIITRKKAIVSTGEFSLRLRKSPSENSEIIDYIANSEKVLLMENESAYCTLSDGQTGRWIQIEHDSKSGWVWSNFLNPLKKAIVSTGEFSLRLRKSPSENSEIIDYIANGEKVILMENESAYCTLSGGQTGRWIQIEYDNKSGWVWGNYLFKL